MKLTLPDFQTDSRPENVIVRAVGRPSVRTPGGYTFRDEMKVDTLGSWFNTDITFVQTDKPIYKPGQLGKSTFFYVTSTSSGQDQNNKVGLYSATAPNSDQAVHFQMSFFLFSTGCLPV